MPSAPRNGARLEAGCNPRRLRIVDRRRTNLGSVRFDQPRQDSTGFEEPALFAEPGIFLVRPDGTLYFGTVQTMPFARPHFADILPAIDFVVKNDYPARGEA
jgi:hypothetical protein